MVIEGRPRVGVCAIRAYCRLVAVGARELGRESFATQAWADALAQLTAADHERPLDVDDLELLATAAVLAGNDVVTDDAWTRAYQAHLDNGDPRSAARAALYLAMQLMIRGEEARGGGWLGRAAGLLEAEQDECAEQGFLMFFGGLQAIFGGDNATACDIFAQVASIADRCKDRDLAALAMTGKGRALIRLGQTQQGVALLDLAMVAITAGEVSPYITGDVYCIVIEGCQEVFDLRRSREWTTALTRWCEAQPDLVPFRGQCLVHRAEIMALHGAWPDAADEAQRACDRFLTGTVHPAAGGAFYQYAEMHRLRGDDAKAEEAYAKARQYGREPQPGLAQLRLAQGKVDTASAAIRRALDEADDPMGKPKLLAAYVDIMLAADDVAAARVAADELTEFAATFEAPMLHAMADRATGAVLLAEGDPRAASSTLRRAMTTWQQLDTPYDAARARVLVGLACRALGDEDSARLELDAARWVFQQLGASPDLARVQKLTGGPTPERGDSPLTLREVQVIRLVATGRTNRAIAGDLFLSEKTVARHVANIFTKLDINSRSAATAYAYEHDLA
jgi:DNA-binding CsgD family transcriptional regulator